MSISNPWDINLIAKSLEKSSNCMYKKTMVKKFISNVLRNEEMLKKNKKIDLGNIYILLNCFTNFNIFNIYKRKVKNC